MLVFRSTQSGNCEVKFLKCRQEVWKLKTPLKENWFNQHQQVAGQKHTEVPFKIQPKPVSAGRRLPPVDNDLVFL